MAQSDLNHLRRRPFKTTLGSDLGNRGHQIRPQPELEAFRGDQASSSSGEAEAFTISSRMRQMHNPQVNGVKELRPNTHLNVFKKEYFQQHSNTLSWHGNASVWTHPRLPNTILADADTSFDRACRHKFFPAAMYFYDTRGRDRPPPALRQHYGITSVKPAH